MLVWLSVLLWLSILVTRAQHAGLAGLSMPPPLLLRLLLQLYSYAPQLLMFCTAVCLHCPLPANPCQRRGQLPER
jgi:hypothetical protein